MYTKIRPPDAAETDKSLEEIKAISQNRLSLEVIITPFRLICTFLLGTLGCVTIPRDKVINRPRIDTLPDALKAAMRTASLFNTDRDRRMANLSFDQARLGGLIFLIHVGRGVLNTAVWFASQLTKNVALWEREAHDMVMTAYETVRPVALVHEDIMDVVQPIERHRSEAAVRGAETAKENREIQKDAEKRGMERGAAMARDEARDEVAGQIKTMMTSLLSGYPEDPPKPVRN